MVAAVIPRSGGLRVGAGGVGGVRGAAARRAALYRRRRVVAGLLVAMTFAGAFLAGGKALDALGGGPFTTAEAQTPAPASDASATSPATAATASSAASDTAGGGVDGPRRTVRLDAEPVSRATYVVRAGDTLWTIARRIQPDGDVRPLVDALASARDGRPLQPGERVVVPMDT